MTRTHRVLDELLEDARALRIVEEDLTKPRGEVHLLTEIIPDVLALARDVHRCWAPSLCVHASSERKHVFMTDNQCDRLQYLRIYHMVIITLTIHLCKYSIIVFLSYPI